MIIHASIILLIAVMYVHSILVPNESTVHHNEEMHNLDNLN